MSKSFVKTQAYSQADFTAISLAPGSQEQFYKASLLVVVLVPVIAYFCQIVGFWVQAPSGHFAIESIQSPWLLLGASCAFCVLMGYFCRFFRRPLNRDLSNQWLRRNSSGWWLGAGSCWQVVEVTGEVLVTQWLIVLQVRPEGEKFTQRVWLWQDAVGADTHRKLRVLLLQRNY